MSAHGTEAEACLIDAFEVALEQYSVAALITHSACHAEEVPHAMLQRVSLPLVGPWQGF